MGGVDELNLSKMAMEKPRVCRRLNFNDDEDDEEPTAAPGGEDNLHNLFYEEMMRSLEEAKKRWNYDFINDKPLKGDYEWVRCDGEPEEQQATPSGEVQPLAEGARGEEGVEQQPEVVEEDDEETVSQ